MEKGFEFYELFDITSFHVDNNSQYVRDKYWANSRYKRFLYQKNPYLKLKITHKYQKDRYLGRKYN